MSYVGGQHAPYRQPCGGPQPEGNYSLSPQHGKSAEKKILRYLNVTRVKDYAVSPNPSGIAPFPSLSTNACLVSGSDCPSVPCGPGGGKCGGSSYITGNPPCDLWPPPNPQCGQYPSGDDWARPSALTDSGTVLIDGNSYLSTSPAQYIDVSNCRKFGFKNVQARKQWHGAPPFLTGGNYLSRSYDPCDNGSCSASVYLKPQYTSPTVKYLTMRVQVNYDHMNSDSTHDTGTRDVTVAINQLSGEAVPTSFSESVTSIGSGSTGCGVLNTLRQLSTGLSVAGDTSSGPGMTIANFFARYMKWIAGTTGLSETCSAGSRSATFNSGTMTPASVSVDTSASFSFHSNASAPIVETASLSDTVFSWSYSETNSGLPESTTWTVTVTLSNPYSITSLLIDLYYLSSQWDLSNDLVYQWRADSFTGIAPLVTRREKAADSPLNYLTIGTVDDKTLPISDCNVPPAVPACPCDGSTGTAAFSLGPPAWIPTYTQRTWFDPQVWCWLKGAQDNGYDTFTGLQRIYGTDGSVKGAPNPAGYDSHFDWDHRTWKQCGDGSPKTAFILAVGAWSGQLTVGPVNINDPTDAAVPKSATQWTENYPDAGNDNPPGAWIRCDQGQSLTIQKWAECIVTRPSYNYARPCGADKTTLDYPTVACVVGSSGPTNIQTASDMSGTWGSGGGTTRLGVAGLGGFGIADGVYPFSNAGGGTSWTLGTKERDFVTVPKFIGSGIAGRILFPTAPSICGRLLISGVTNTNPIQITTSGHNLATGDLVDITSVTGTTSANVTNQSVTRVDANNFTIAVAGNGDWTGGGFVSSTGAANYKWYDNFPKGDYVVAQWDSIHRDIQESQINCQNSTACACASAPFVSPSGGSCPGGGSITVTCSGSDTNLRTSQAVHGMPREVKDFGVTQECYVFDRCNPAVVCFSPDGEVFPNSTTIAIPFGGYDTIADTVYNCMWQAAVVQAVDDYLWQPPNKPCADCTTEGGSIGPSQCDFKEDIRQSTTPCEADTCIDDCCATGAGVCCPTPETCQTRYYPFRPQVEARTSLAVSTSSPFDTAPSLPTGRGPVGYLALWQLESQCGTVPDGNVLPPTIGGGYDANDYDLKPISKYLLPWVIYSEQFQCVCSGGRWKTDYQNDGVCC